MIFNDILLECKHLKIYEKRCVGDDFAEIVFYNDEISEWSRIISEHLGPPRKPSGQDPSEADLKLTAHTGGIRFEQTLFEREYPQGTVIAKFWPWKDNQHTTLRMALLKK